MQTETFNKGDATSRRKQVATDLKRPTGEQYISFDVETNREKPSKIWKGRRVLKVYLMNSKVLKDWKNGTSIADILAWANSWNSTVYEHIPRFEETREKSLADIRVSFSSMYIHNFLMYVNCMLS